jgi:hypothetical protein
MRVKQTCKRAFVAVALMLLVPAAGYAAQSSSTNYQVNEVFFGAGGALKDCSTNYCAKESVGETTVGNPSSPNYQAHAGFNTDRTPFLQFIVDGTNTDIGVLSTGATSTTTATFSVKNYLSHGYQVVTVSNPPKNNAYGMHNLTAPTAANPGHEQFGMNLVKNQSCGGLSGPLGNDPVQVPSSNFSYGKVASGYNLACSFKYVPGDTIAYSDSSSGETDFEISYIYNISNITPGGTYDFNDVLVATATF